MHQEESIIQKDSPRALNHPVQGKDFLQSDEWRNFQQSVGRKTFCVSKDNFYASVIEHELPIVGKYFYVPRGPIIINPKPEILNPKQIQNSKFKIQNSFSELINLARKNKAGWIRIEPIDDNLLNLIKENIKHKITKAPHDMQPREIFVIDITKSEEELLGEMKQKTRYNIKVAQKHGVVTRNMKHETCNIDIEEFIKLVKITAQRDKITPHPESYYRQMFKIIPPEILKLYVAEYENKIIAANIVIHYGNTATYLHGASDNEYRNVMAPYLLQWQAILDAKKSRLNFYDLGGVKILNPKSEIPASPAGGLNPKQIQNSKFQIKNSASNSWHGITKFKTGFSPETKPIEFPGSYDIIINSRKYWLYRFIQKFIP
jgi:peptidoglycan pentaglycine glycine transferase (the first glycine)